MTDKKAKTTFKRSHLIVFLSCLVLSALIGVTYYLQTDQRTSALAYYEDQQISLRAASPDTVGRDYVVSRSDLMQLQTQTISATRRTSTGEVSEHVYEGILLRDLLKAYHLAEDDFEQAIISAVDGYQTILPLQRIYEQDHVFLVFIENGLPLRDRSQKGDGPYMLVILEEAFSQSWCKYVVEVSLQ